MAELNEEARMVRTPEIECNDFTTKSHTLYFPSKLSVSMTKWAFDRLTRYHLTHRLSRYVRNPSKIILELRSAGDETLHFLRSHTFQKLASIHALHYHSFRYHSVAQHWVLLLLQILVVELGERFWWAMIYI